MSRLIDEYDAMLGFASLGQTTRLAVLRKLLKVHPDGLNAGDIARMCAVPHNTMSAHLSVLSRAGLVSVERQGRVMHYRADLRGFRGLVEFLARDCCGGRPELCADILQRYSDMNDDAHAAEKFMTPTFSVLFLCTHNSARSIMAEAVLEKIGRGHFRAYSAGAEPAKAPLPEVINRLKVLGHDVSRLRCKSWDEFKRPDAPRMDFIVALCDVPHGQFCSDLAGEFVIAAWPLPDPASFKGSATERTTLVNELYAMIRRRLEIFTSLPFASFDRVALKARLDEIGDTARVLP